jgi:hypothetical protein
MRTLTIQQLMEVAQTESIPGAGLLCERVVAAADELAQCVAAHFDLKVSDTNWESLELEGLCSTFYPARANQEINAEIFEDMDKGGDWDPPLGTFRCKTCNAYVDEDLPGHLAQHHSGAHSMSMTDVKACFEEL